MKKVKVLYIASWGRSGSTMLENVLDQTEGFFSVAEIYQLWNFGLLNGGLCGCGEPVTRCPLWSAVIERAYGFTDRALPLEMVQWRDTYVKTRYLPFIHLVSNGSVHPDATGLARLDALYRAIGEETGCRVIVDSSKHPLYGALVGRLPSVDMYLVHLVRHPYAVAYSWLRKKKMRDANTYFRVRSPLETSVYWRVWNQAIQTLGRSMKGRYRLVRYEDFVSAPHRSLNSIYQLLDEEPACLPVDESNHFTMQQNHTIFGNPVKYKRGRIQIQADTEWKSKLSVLKRSVIAAATWPLMQQYGYHR